MTDTPIIMHEQQFQQLRLILGKLRLESFSRVVFLVDKNGQQIASAGEVEQFDTTSLASLTAGNVAATDGLGRTACSRRRSGTGRRKSRICRAGRAISGCACLVTFGV